MAESVSDTSQPSSYGPGQLENPLGDPEPGSSPQTELGLATAAQELEVEKQQQKAKREAKAGDKQLHGYKLTMNGEQMLQVGQKLLESCDFIFISLDLELWELDTSVITEIGISVLDMTKQTQWWSPNFETWHLIPAEAKHQLNGRRVADKRHLFTQGKSRILTMAQCREFWAELITSLKPKSQKVFYVGQSVKDDLYYLSKNGFSLDRSVPVLDTQLIWESQCSLPCSLGKMLKHLEMPHAFLHNAGNDAYYTLRLLVMILDQPVRDKYELDVGPSRSEAERVSREHRKPRSDDPDELPVVLSLQDQALKDEEDKISKMAPIAREEYVAKKRLEREKSRLQESLDDMPGEYIHVDEDEFEGLIAKLNEL